MKLLYVCHQPRFKADMRPGRSARLLACGSYEVTLLCVGDHENSKLESANRMELDMLSRLICCSEASVQGGIPLSVIRRIGILG